MMAARIGEGFLVEFVDTVLEGSSPNIFKSDRFMLDLICAIGAIRMRSSESTLPSNSYLLCGLSLLNNSVVLKSLLIDFRNCEKYLTAIILKNARGF
jgi:hypothetical protein